jgi:hypothetical protein
MCPFKHVPATNVANVNWHKDNSKWLVRYVNAETRKMTYYCLARTFDEACVKREEAQEIEGKRGPGELQRMPGGELVAACGLCRKVFGIASFAPEPCMTKKEFAKFSTACAEAGSKDASVARPALDLLKRMPDGKSGSALRRSLCQHCRDVSHKTRIEGPDSASAKCAAMRDTIREDMARRGCRDCVEDRYECMELEHEGRVGKRPGCRSVLHYTWYAAKFGHAGPEKMWEDYCHSSVVVLCKCCHAVQDTHSGARGADSATLEEGSGRKRLRKYREKNQAYNNELKRTFQNVIPGPFTEEDLEIGDEGLDEHGNRVRLPGYCYYCDFHIEPGNERAMEWMHNKDELKNYTISANSKKRMYAEVYGTNGGGGARLGCANCHEACETAPGREEGREKWDTLMQNPVVSHFWP